jgi:hypothetical protein
MNIENCTKKKSDETFNVISTLSGLACQNDAVGLFSQVGQAVMKPVGSVDWRVCNRDRLQFGLDMTGFAADNLASLNVEFFKVFICLHGPGIVFRREQPPSISRRSSACFGFSAYLVEFGNSHHEEIARKADTVSYITDNRKVEQMAEWKPQESRSDGLNSILSRISANE